MSATYIDKEISEWNSTDLSSWLLDNKYRGISELCQKYTLSGYDLFYINDDILKNELGLNSFHERVVTKKLINKLTSEHLKLNIVNSNGDNVVLTLDNNQNTTLGDISQYIGNMFDIEPNCILYKDNTKQEVLSPTLKIIQLMILYPRIYKTLNISNMKDFHNLDDKMINNENNEGINSISKTGETISRTVDKNDENEKINNNITLNNNNIDYSFRDNSRDLNSNSISNNISNNLSNNYMVKNNKYYKDISPINYKPPSNLSDSNQNNLMLNNNRRMNVNEVENQKINNITLTNMGNNRKNKSEKRVYRDKGEFYYNYNNMENNQTEYIRNKEEKNILTTSSNEENDNREGEMKYNSGNYEESNDIDNDNKMNNNYEVRKINIESNEYRKNRRNDVNNNYYVKNMKNNYNEENMNNNDIDNDDNNEKRRRFQIKKGYNEGNIYKEKIYNENFNDSNDYYK